MLRFDLDAPALEDGRRRVEDLTLYPARDGFQLLTYTHATPTAEGVVAQELFLLLQPTEASALFDGTQQQPAYAWWAEPMWHYGMWVGGSVLVGVAWPTLLRRLASAPTEEAGVLLTPGRGPAAAGVGASAEEREAAIAELEGMNATLSEGLADGTDASGAEAGAVSADPVNSKPAPLLTSPDEPSREAEPAAVKQYAGEIYPTELGGRSTRGCDAAGFSLVELLVVISIIAVLVGILLPVLAEAWHAAIGIACGSNLRNVGQGIGIYVAENDGHYMPAYLYAGHRFENGQQLPEYPTEAGYLHWSSYLMGQDAVESDVFTCPGLERGSLPPTNTTADNLDPGQYAVIETTRTPASGLSERVAELMLTSEYEWFVQTPVSLDMAGGQITAVTTAGGLK